MTLHKEHCKYAGFEQTSHLKSASRGLESGENGFAGGGIAERAKSLLEQDLGDGCAQLAEMLSGHNFGKQPRSILSANQMNSTLRYRLLIILQPTLL